MSDISMGEKKFVPPTKEVELEFKPPRAILWRMVIEPYSPPSQIGSIHLPDEAQETERMLTNVGKVIHMGPLCYAGKTSSGLSMGEGEVPKVGDWVVFGVYGGQKIRTKSGRNYLIVNDDNILGVIESPTDYRFWL